MIHKDYKNNRYFKILYGTHEQVIKTTKLVLKTYGTLQDKNITRWVKHYLSNLDVYNLINIPFKAVDLLKEAELFYEVKTYHVGTPFDLRRHGIGMTFKATSIIRTLGKGVYALGEKGYLPLYKTLKVINLPSTVFYDLLYALQTTMKIAKYQEILKEIPSTSHTLNKKKLRVIRTYLKKNIFIKNLTPEEKRKKCRRLKDRAILIQEQYIKEGTNPAVLKQMRKCRQLSERQFFNPKNQDKITNAIDNARTLVNRKVKCQYASATSSVVHAIAISSIIFSLAPEVLIASLLWSIFVMETYLGIYELFYINKNFKSSIS